MTASEMAERKKELSENFTLEELVDMYLASEWRYEDAVNAAKVREGELEVAIEVLRADIEDVEAERKAYSENVVKPLQQRISEIEGARLLDLKEINRLNTALDVLIDRYVALKKVPRK